MRLLLVSLFCLTCQVRAQQVIRCAGSDTLGAKLIPQLAEIYKSKHPEIKFEIAAEGSSTAFTKLLDGSADIGMSSREIKPEETSQFKAKGIKLDTILVTHDMLCVIVNARNPIDSLSRKQVESVFTGDVVNWKDVGGSDLGIQLYPRNTSSGTYKDFKKMAMSGREYGPSAKKMVPAEVIQVVKSDEAGISYAGIAYAKASGIKALKIDGKEPTAENVESYAYTRACYFYVRSDVSGPVRDFVTWASQSPEAKEIAGRVGFVPPK